MSIQSEIDRLQAAKSAIAAALQTMGVEPPQGTTLDQYAAQLTAIAASAPWLPLSGGTMTGDLCLDDGVEIKSLGQDQHSLVFEQGGIRLKDNGAFGARILGLDAPYNNDDAATKGYVDGLVGDINSVLDAINGEVV